MFIQKKANKKNAVKASTRRVRRAVRANDDINEEAIVEVPEEASDLLFEAEDVAELVAEVTGEDVAVTVEEEAVTFEVGDDAYIVEAEGDEEILESTRRPLRGKATVKAATRRRARR